MITQDDIITGKPNNFIPFKIEAFRECLIKVREWLQKQPVAYRIQMPTIGSRLARGDWSENVKVIQEELVDHGFDVHVVELFKSLTETKKKDD